MVIALLAGCAAHNKAPAQTPVSSTADSSTSAECVRPRKPSRFREMTWQEYYADVRERAWRNSATIIWITPPKVKKQPVVRSTASACVR
jgi:hypothetical protein